MTTIVSQATAKGVVIAYQNPYVFGNNVPVLLTGSGVGAIFAADDVDNGTEQEIGADGTIIASVNAVLVKGTITFAPGTPGLASIIQVSNWQQQYNLVALGTLTLSTIVNTSVITYNNFQLLSAYPGQTYTTRSQDRAFRWSAPLPTGPNLTDFLSLASSIQSAVSSI